MYCSCLCGHIGVVSLVCLIGSVIVRFVVFDPPRKIFGTLNIVENGYFYHKPAKASSSVDHYNSNLKQFVYC